MTSIRKFLFAAVLAASALNFNPSLASAQEAMHGRFTLPHEVRWTDFRLPAGDYEFSLFSNSLAPVVHLRRLGGVSQRFMILAPATEDSNTSDSTRLELVSTPAGSFVKAMHLPEIGLTLDFNVPARVTGRSIAKVMPGTLTSGQ